MVVGGPIYIHHNPLILFITLFYFLRVAAATAATTTIMCGVSVLHLFETAHLILRFNNFLVVRVTYSNVTSSGRLNFKLTSTAAYVSANIKIQMYFH